MQRTLSTRTPWDRPSGPALAQLTNRIVSVYKAALGRGPTGARVDLVGDDLLVCRLDDTLTTRAHLETCDFLDLLLKPPRDGTTERASESQNHRLPAILEEVSLEMGERSSTLVAERRRSFSGSTRAPGPRAAIRPLSSGRLVPRSSTRPPPGCRGSVARRPPHPAREARVPPSAQARS